MNKTELIAALAQATETTKADATRAVDAFIELTSQALAQGDSVTLPGLGIFKIAERAARKGKNPSTGQSIDIPASKAVKFTTAKALKEQING